MSVIFHYAYDDRIASMAPYLPFVVDEQFVALQHNPALLPGVLFVSLTKLALFGRFV